MTSESLKVLEKDELENFLLNPMSEIGRKIDWSKVFHRVGLYHKKPINWNLVLDDKGDFNERNFIMGNRSSYENKNKLIIEAEEVIENIKKCKKYKAENPSGDNCLYQYKTFINEYIKLLDNVFFLGNQYEKEGERTDVYVQYFFYKLKEIKLKLEKYCKNEIYDNENIEDIEDIEDEIINYINKGKSWVEEMWIPYENKTIKGFKETASEYIKPGNILDVDKVLEALNSHWDWNEDALIYVFYTAECSREELERLQKGVLIALDSKFNRLDTTKIFSIIEFVLPYIYNSFENISFKLPELFNPKYLSKIIINDLTIENFIKQIYNLGRQNNWSEEIQANLINQFTKYGASEKGKIGFGQGSEQLFYWLEVTGYLNEKNYKNYLKSDDLGEDKRPIPNILKDIINYTQEGYKNIARGLIEGKKL